MTLLTTAETELDAPPAPPTRQPSLASRYTGAMLYFMGAALIAGAVVHYPIDPPTYTVICVVGALVFLLGTVVNELVLAPERPALGRAASLVTFSLLLSFGVGLVGGGIQHFEQFPERSAAMTPIGLLLSYAAFVAKDAEGSWRHLFGLFGAGVVVTATLTWLGMSALADTLDSDGHSHDHGSTSTRDEAPAEHPAEAPAQPAEHPAEQPVDEPAQESDDGHSGHSH